MINLKTGEVKKIIREEKKALFLKVETSEGVVDAVLYSDLVPEIEEGDLVVLNTTALDLELGSGGYGFVLGTLFRSQPLKKEEGHLMKLRYTPLQFATQALEETEEKEKIEDKRELGGAVCIVAELLSQIPPLAFALHELAPSSCLVYIMTESAALPLPFSVHIAECQKRNWIHRTITYGQAFGGDRETVNIFTALLTARWVEKGDFVLLSQGVGGVGMESHFGFSALDLLFVLQAIHSLKATPIFVPRVSFQEKRERHYGLSHHSRTILEMLSFPVFVPFPGLTEEREKFLLEQIEKCAWSSLHFIEKREVGPLWEKWLACDWGITSMGRKSREDPAFFQASFAAALLASEMVKEAS